MSSSSPASPAAPAPPPPAPKRRRPLLLVIAAVAVIAAVVYALHWWTTGRFIESTDDAYLKADGVTVAPKVGGYATDVFVVANQRVKRGDPLVRLDQRQYQAALDQSQASNVPLAVTGAATGEHLVDLRTARDQAAASLAASLAAVDAVQGQLKSSQAQVAQSRAQVKAAEAALRQNHLDVNDTVVRAAIDGRIGDTTVQVGQLVQPGTRLMTVVPTQDVYLVANFKETQIARMRAGQPATLHVDALPDADLHGSVESFSPGTGAQFALLPSENATGNFTKIVQRVPVRIHVQADAAMRERLLPGLSVTVDVDTRGDGAAAAPVPASAARHG